MSCPSRESDYFEEYPLDVLFDSPECVEALKDLIREKIPSRKIDVNIDPDEDFSSSEIEVKVNIVYSNERDGPMNVYVDEIYGIIQKYEPEKWAKYGAAWESHFSR
jgi:hypothetical protein